MRFRNPSRSTRDGAQFSARRDTAHSLPRPMERTWLRACQKQAGANLRRAHVVAGWVRFAGYLAPLPELENETNREVRGGWRGQGSRESPLDFRLVARHSDVCRWSL